MRDKDEAGYGRVERVMEGRWGGAGQELAGSDITWEHQGRGSGGRTGGQEVMGRHVGEVRTAAGDFAARD